MTREWPTGSQLDGHSTHKSGWRTKQMRLPWKGYPIESHILARAIVKGGEVITRQIVLKAVRIKVIREIKELHSQLCTLGARNTLRD